MVDPGQGSNWNKDDGQQYLGEKPQTWGIRLPELI